MQILVDNFVERLRHMQENSVFEQFFTEKTLICI